MKSLFVLLFILATLGNECFGQVVLKDQQGFHLYIHGTVKDDVVFVWEKDGELKVSVNEETTNITEKTGLKAKQLQSIGANLFDGDDTVAYFDLPAIKGGTRTNGGRGSNVVLKGKGEHRGTDITHWAEQVSEAPAKGKAASEDLGMMMERFKRAPKEVRIGHVRWMDTSQLVAKSVLQSVLKE